MVCVVFYVTIYTCHYVAFNKYNQKKRVNKGGLTCLTLPWGEVWHTIIWHVSRSAETSGGLPAALSGIGARRISTIKKRLQSRGKDRTSFPFKLSSEWNRDNNQPGIHPEEKNAKGDLPLCGFIHSPLLNTKNLLNFVLHWLRCVCVFVNCDLPQIMCSLTGRSWSCV